VQSSKFQSLHYKIGRIRKHLDQRSTERLIHAFISSRLDCNNGLLYGLPKKRDHITPVIKNLHWLTITIRQRIDFKILLQCVKLFTKRGLNICPCLVEHKRGKTRSSSSITLAPKRFKTNFGERRFSASGPFLWNRMPESIREAKTIDAFQVTLELCSIQIYVKSPAENLRLPGCRNHQTCQNKVVNSTIEYCSVNLFEYCKNKKIGVFIFTQ
jgi:hypothetical protein